MTDNEANQNDKNRPSADEPEAPAPPEADREDGQAQTESAPAAAADENMSGAQLDDESFKSAVEAVLFAGDKPLSARKLAEILGTGDGHRVRAAVKELQKYYAETRRAFQVEEIAGGYQIFTLPEFHPWVQRLGKSNKEEKLSQAALETLAIVAYRQPILRADIEAIRGVQCGPMLRALIERGLVKVAGKSEDLGRPLLYGTTNKFMEVFGLKSLKDLPKAQELVQSSAPGMLSDEPGEDTDEEKQQDHPQQSE